MSIPQHLNAHQDRSVRVWDLNTLAMLASLEQASLTFCMKSHRNTSKTILKESLRHIL